MGESSVIKVAARGGRATRPRTSVLAVAVLAAAWTAAYAVLYVWVASHQDDPAVAWWYVGVLALAGAISLVAPFAGSRVVLGAAAAVLLAGCALIGLLSVGILLVPAVVLAVLAAALPGVRPRPRTAG